MSEDGSPSSQDTFQLIWGLKGHTPPQVEAAPSPISDQEFKRTDSPDVPVPSEVLTSSLLRAALRPFHRRRKPSTDRRGPWPVSPRTRE